jgi:hypothetical protein
MVQAIKPATRTGAVKTEGASDASADAGQGPDVDALLDQKRSEMTQQALNESIALGSSKMNELRAVFFTNIAYTGAFVEDCRGLFNWRKTEKHLPRNALDKGRVSIVKCKLAFLDTQLSAVTHILTQSFGCFPLDSRPTWPGQLPPTAVQAELVDKNRHPCLGGPMLADGTGLRKTRAALLALNVVIRNNDHTYSLLDFEPCNLPNMVVLPSMSVMLQWAEDAKANFPDFRGVVLYSTSRPNRLTSKIWWQAGKFLKRPKEDWPAKHQYMFNEEEPEASRVILVTTFNMLTTHSLSKRGLSKKELEGLKAAKKPIPPLYR